MVQVRPVWIRLAARRRFGVGRTTLSLLPRLGKFDSGEILHRLVDQPWTCAGMGFPKYVRRTLVLYQCPKADPSLSAATRPDATT